MVSLAPLSQPQQQGGCLATPQQPLLPLVLSSLLAPLEAHLSQVQPLGSLSVVELLLDSRTASINSHLNQSTPGKSLAGNDLEDVQLLAGHNLPVSHSICSCSH